MKTALTGMASTAREQGSSVTGSPFPASKLGNAHLPAAHPLRRCFWAPLSLHHPTDRAAEVPLATLCTAFPRLQLSYTLSAVCSSSHWCQGGRPAYHVLPEDRDHTIQPRPRLNSVTCTINI